MLKNVFLTHWNGRKEAESKLYENKINPIVKIPSSDLVEKDVNAIKAEKRFLLVTTAKLGISRQLIRDKDERDAN